MSGIGNASPKTPHRGNTNFKGISSPASSSQHNLNKIPLANSTERSIRTSEGGFRLRGFNKRNTMIGGSEFNTSVNKP